MRRGGRRQVAILVLCRLLVLRRNKTEFDKLRVERMGARMDLKLYAISVTVVQKKIQAQPNYDK